MDKLPVKRWGIIDTINLCLMIAVCLFIVDFQHQPGLSWVLTAAFTIWLITVLIRNLYINKYRRK